MFGANCLITTALVILYILNDFKNPSPTILEPERLGPFIFYTFPENFIHNEKLTVLFTKVEFIQL